MENVIMTPASYVKKTLLAALQCLPYLNTVHAVACLPLLRVWHQSKARGSHLVPSRRSLHEAIARDIGNDRILYLEFGVYQGDSIKYWLHLNGNPLSKFVGFDTFTGLPEPWQRNFATVAQNAFDAGGAVPIIEDDRCSFKVGLFQHTLRPFVNFLERMRYDRVVLHMDADLYSATLFALCECDSILLSNDIVLFDEFSSIFNEFKALDDWSGAYLRNYEVLYHTQWTNQICIRLV
jgi:O-methyltransferase